MAFKKQGITFQTSSNRFFVLEITLSNSYIGNIAMPLYLRLIHLAPQPSLLAERCEEIVPAEAGTQVQMLGDFGNGLAGAAETQYLALIVSCARTFSEGIDSKILKHPFLREEQPVPQLQTAEHSAVFEIEDCRPTDAEHPHNILRAEPVRVIGIELFQLHKRAQL